MSTPGAAVWKIPNMLSGSIGTFRGTMVDGFVFSSCSILRILHGVSFWKVERGLRVLYFYCCDRYTFCGVRLCLLRSSNGYCKDVYGLNCYSVSYSDDVKSILTRQSSVQNPLARQSCLCRLACGSSELLRRCRGLRMILLLPFLRSFLPSRLR